jgi:hypothetical protein
MIMTILLSGLAMTATGQSVQGDPADISFKIINATTGEAGTIDRLEIHYLTERPNPVLDVEPEGSSFTIPDVPIKDRGKYILTAWYQDVPYFWSIRGRQILDETLTLHVFDTSGDLAQVSMTGLNLLLRKGESVVDLEFMLKIDNAARPQVTVTGSPTVELDVPAGATGFEAHYTRGPSPIDVPVRSLGAGRVGLDVPLTSGQNQVRFTCKVPWQEGLDVPVGSNLPVDAWSLLATPENLDIRSFDLSPDRGQDLPGFLRFIGPSLEADPGFRFEVKSRIAAGQAEEVFTAEVPGDEDEDRDAEEENDDGGFPFLVLVPIFVVLIIILARRRSS